VSFSEWEDPFSIPTQIYHYIEIYLHYLNEDMEYGIDNNLLLYSNTLFNYSSLYHINFHMNVHA
jgi:hypothetical protein